MGRPKLGCRIWLGETSTMPIATPTARCRWTRLMTSSTSARPFRPMENALRPLVERGVLPQASYVLPDGTPMVPADHDSLLTDAGGDPDGVAARFRDRFIAAGGDAEAVDEEHAAWLSGEYGVCLRSATPEAIVAKSGLMTAISALLARPVAEDEGWQAALRGAVDALDAIVAAVRPLRPGSVRRSLLEGSPDHGDARALREPVAVTAAADRQQSARRLVAATARRERRTSP